MSARLYDSMSISSWVLSFFLFPILIMSAFLPVRVELVEKDTHICAYACVCACVCMCVRGERYVCQCLVILVIA